MAIHHLHNFNFVAILSLTLTCNCNYMYQWSQNDSCYFDKSCITKVVHFILGRHMGICEHMGILGKSSMYILPLGGTIHLTEDLLV